jgi:hypothetical protein
MMPVIVLVQMLAMRFQHALERLLSTPNVRTIRLHRMKEPYLHLMCKWVDYISGTVH